MIRQNALRMLALLIALTLVLSACAPAPTPAPATQPPAAPTEAPAVTEAPAATEPPAAFTRLRPDPISVAPAALGEIQPTVTAPRGHRRTHRPARRNELRVHAQPRLSGASRRHF